MSSAALNSDAKILVVEDEAELRTVLVEICGALSNHVSAAVNGKRGLELALNENFDVILSDIKMPEMNGLDFLEKLREAGVQTPFVVLSGFGDKDMVLSALRLGAYDFLEKPAKRADVLEVLRKALALGVKLRGLPRLPPTPPDALSGLNHLIDHLAVENEKLKLEVKQRKS